MLGDLIYEGKGRIIHSRILIAGENNIEYTLMEEGKLKDTDVSVTSTFWTIPVGKNTVYGEAQAIITANNSRETVTYRGYGVGYSDRLGKTIFRGTNLYSASPNGKLAFVNNIVGAVEAEAYENHHSGKVWEWK